MPRSPVPRPPAPLPPPGEPTGQDNAIGEDGPGLGPPGPALVDDFYYDYNFIRFHENLSQDEDEEPGPDPMGPGDRPASPLPGSGPDEPPAPGPSRAGPHLPPLSGQTPWDPLLNFLPEGDAPTGTPAPGLPSSPWPPASVGATPATPGGQEESPAPSQPPRPRWESTNEVPEDEDGALGPPGLPLPGIPESPPLSSTHPSPRPDSEELWPPVAAAPPAASLPGAQPGPAPRDLQTPAVPGDREPGGTPLSPAGDSPSDSSRGPLGPPPTRNASWEVGDWSQASVGGSRPPCLSFPAEQWVGGRPRGSGGHRGPPLTSTGATDEGRPGVFSLRLECPRGRGAHSQQLRVGQPPISRAPQALSSG